MADIAHHNNSEKTENIKDIGIWKTSAESLVLRLKSGDRKAAEELVEVFYRQIYWYFRRLGYNSYLSEDMTQECFMLAWNNISKLRDANVLKSWLYRIAGNISSNYWRKHKNVKETDIQLLQIADNSLNTDESPSNSDKLNTLQKAVFALPYKMREVIVLHYLQDLSIENTAEALAIRKGTCKSRLNKGLKLLKEIFI